MTDVSLSPSDGTVVLPVNPASSNRVKWFRVTDPGLACIILVMCLSFPAITGIVLLSQIHSWEAWDDNANIFLKQGKGTNPFIISGSIFLSFGILLLAGGLYGIYWVKRRREQQQLNVPYTTVLRPTPVVSGQMNLPSQEPSAPLRQNEDSGQLSFIEPPPPPYWSKESPSPTYQK